VVVVDVSVVAEDSVVVASVSVEASVVVAFSVVVDASGASVVLGVALEDDGVAVTSSGSRSFDSSS
jgi:hypothetical protein